MGCEGNFGVRFAVRENKTTAGGVVRGVECKGIYGVI